MGLLNRKDLIDLDGPGIGIDAVECGIGPGDVDLADLPAALQGDEFLVAATAGNGAPPSVVYPCDPLHQNILTEA